MKNILFLTTDSRIGGAEKMILQLIQSLKNINPVLCTLMSEGAINGYAKKMGIQEYSLGVDSPHQIGRSLKLKEILNKCKIDIVHTHLYHANILGHYFSRWMNINKFVYTMHRIHKKTLLRNLNNRLLKQSHYKIICVSRSIQQKLVEVLGIPLERLPVIYNGIKDEYPFWARSVVQKKELKRNFGIAPDSYVISIVANLNSKKGHHRFLDILKEQGFERKYICLIIGDGPLMKSLVKKVQDYGLSEYVRFLGHQENVYPLLALSDLFVLPSIDEGLPVSVIEAMMMKLPIVATNVGGIRELIEDGYSGTIASSASRKNLTEGIQFHMSQPEKSLEMANNARGKYLEKFQLESMVLQTQNVYNGLS